MSLKGAAARCATRSSAAKTSAGGAGHDTLMPLAAATLEAHPAVVLVGIAALGRQVLEHDLPIIARDSTIAVVCVLDAPDPQLAARMLRVGLHAVIAKPVHVTEIERLLFGSRNITEEIQCPPFS